jgi:hypothetical protein
VDAPVVGVRSDFLGSSYNTIERIFAIIDENIDTAELTTVRL